MFGVSGYSSEDGRIQLPKRSCWLLSTLSMGKFFNKSDIAQLQSATYVLQIYPWLGMQEFGGGWDLAPVIFDHGERCLWGVMFTPWPL